MKYSLLYLFAGISIGNTLAQNLETVHCVFEKTESKITAQHSAVSASAEAIVVPDYQSNPGATKVLFLDFDGYNKPYDSWGAPTVYGPAKFTSAEIDTILSLVTEDYAPFNVNITTNEGVYNAAASTNKMRGVICYDINNAGGSAHVNSFGTAGEMYLVYQGIVSDFREVGLELSHEFGHTLGLSHASYAIGTDAPDYYTGHNDWGPIMGLAFIRHVRQFSKGEYANAFGTQDQLLSISNYLPYKNDDHGDNKNNATEIVFSINGNTATVNATSNKGLIGRTEDVDYFHFKINSYGEINLQIKPTAIKETNLDVEVKLFDASNNLITTVGTTHFNNPANLENGTTLKTTLPAGDYYLQVDGVGTGNPSTGWSDYDSMGPYAISGTLEGMNMSTSILSASVNNLILSPNPVQNQLNFSKNVALVNIFDLSGKLICTYNNTSSIFFEDEKITPGIYFVKVLDKGETGNFKIIKM